jgi:hypothetical protein
VAEEGATPDRVEIVLGANDAWNRRDVDGWLSFLSPDIVLRPISTRGRLDDGHPCADSKRPVG